MVGGDEMRVGDRNGGGGRVEKNSDGAGKPPRHIVRTCSTHACLVSQPAVAQSQNKCLAGQTVPQKSPTGYVSLRINCSCSVLYGKVSRFWYGPTSPSRRRSSNHHNHLDYMPIWDMQHSSRLP